MLQMGHEREMGTSLFFLPKLRCHRPSEAHAPVEASMANRTLPHSFAGPGRKTLRCTVGYYLTSPRVDSINNIGVL